MLLRLLQLGLMDQFTSAALLVGRFIVKNSGAVGRMVLLLNTAQMEFNFGLKQLPPLDEMR